MSHLVQSLRQRAFSTAAFRNGSATAALNALKSPRGVDSSASAAEYKLAHPPKRRLPLTTTEPRSWTAEEAVNNILYNTPPPSLERTTRHTLNCLVQNEPGVLSRVSGILAARGFNIDSLVVCATEIEDLSRMCIVLRGQDSVIEQARRQLEDLVPVWAVLDYTKTRTVQRELLMAKISILGPEYFEDQLAHKGADILPATEGVEAGSPARQHIENTRDAAESNHPAAAGHGHSAVRAQGLSPAEALREKHTHMRAIAEIATHFGGKVVDMSHDCVIVELTGKTERVDAFLKLVRPYGILEAARSGLMVMPRAPIASPWTGMADTEDFDDASEAVDSSLLPPG